MRKACPWEAGGLPTGCITKQAVAEEECHAKDSMYEAQEILRTAGHGSSWASLPVGLPAALCHAGSCMTIFIPLPSSHADLPPARLGLHPGPQCVPKHPFPVSPSHPPTLVSGSGSLCICLSQLFLFLITCLCDFLCRRLFDSAPAPISHTFSVSGWRFPLPDLCSTPALPC